MSGRHAAPKRSIINRARTSGSERTNVAKHRSGDTYRPHERVRTNKLIRRVGAAALAAGMLFGGGSSLLDKVDGSKPTTTTVSSESLERSKHSTRSSTMGRFALKGFGFRKEVQLAANSNPETAPEIRKTAKPDFVYYSQFAPDSAYATFGSTGKLVKDGGCGPDSIAMVAASLTGNKDITTSSIAKAYGKHYKPGEGTKHTLYADVADDYDIDLDVVEDAHESEDEIRETLSKGGYAIISGGNGHYPFTSGPGHVVVVRGTNQEGDFLLANPMPRLADQGKTSAEVQANTDWYNTAYSFDELEDAGLHSSTYLFTKNES